MTMTSVAVAPPRWGSGRRSAPRFDLRRVGLADRGHQRLQSLGGEKIATAIGERPFHLRRELMCRMRIGVAIAGS